MKILFLLYPNERNMTDRKAEWGSIEGGLTVEYENPIIMDDDVLNNSDVIITHRQEYADNIKIRLTNTKSLVVVFSGGVHGIKRDNNRDHTLWVEFPKEIGKIILYIKKLSNNKGTINYQSVIEDLITEQPHHYSLRSQILTPFVALQLILQMEPKERESSISESEADLAFAEAGLALLKGNGSELKKKISELSGTPFNEDKINKFIEDYADHLSAVFQGILTDKQIKLPIGDNALAGIEQLFKIVEDEIEKSDLKKKARVIKHDLDNVMRRLDNCITPLSPEKLEVIKGGMDRLDSIFKELNTLKESLHLDMQNELDSASELIRKIREGVKTNLEESRLLELRDELVCVLQKPFIMIVSVTTGQEK